MSPSEGLVWRKASSTYANGQCVELARLADGRVAVRDSKQPEGPWLYFTPAEIAAFLDGARGGEFDDLAEPA